MKPMISILVLYPEHLNLNGDAANAGILARRLNWFGFDAAIEFHHPGEQLPTTHPDFLILGHGSDAAWSALHEPLIQDWQRIRRWIDDGVHGLAINSGQELLHGIEFGVFPPGLERGERKSHFRVVEADCIEAGAKLLGYQNSEFNAPGVERYNNFIGTQLHGPVLAKNGWLADWFIARITGEAHLASSPNASSYLEQTKKFETEIWTLESELADE